MEFEEMRRIWDSQNNEPLYAINEKALHRRIKAKKNKASIVSNINEITLMAIAILTAIPLFIKNVGVDNIYAYPPVIILLLTGVYVWIGRQKRMKKEKQFDQTIIGDLDQAIANVSFEVNRAKTFIFWYLLPLSFPVFLNMYMNEASFLKWAIVIGGFILSYIVVRAGLTYSQIPNKRRLEALREKLMREMGDSMDNG